MKTRRAQRGFTILETLMAGAVMLLGITGLMVLLLGIRNNSARAAFNTLAAKEAQRLLNMRTTGDLADTGPVGVTPCNGVFEQINLPYECDITVMDTSSNVPPIIPPNLGVPSRLVVVRIRRVQSALNSPTWHVQQGYALPPP